MFLSGDLLKEMPNILGWLDELGFESSKIRYSKYANHIENFFDCKNPLSDDGLEKFNLCTKSFIELMTLFDIYLGFQGERSKGFIDKLEKAIGGQEHPEGHLAGPSRDYLFELLVAKMFYAAGYKIDFEATTDVVAKNSKYTVHAECKRISSEKKFEENCKTAEKQLKREMGKAGTPFHGIIFVDITNCIAGIPAREFRNSADASFFIDDKFKNFEIQNSRLINRINDRFIDSSLGVYLISRIPAWIEDLSLLLFRKSSVIAPKHLPDDRFNKLEDILRDFPRK